MALRSEHGIQVVAEVYSSVPLGEMKGNIEPSTVSQYLLFTDVSRLAFVFDLHVEVHGQVHGHQHGRSVRFAWC